jgi:hypothetical protein
MQAKENVAYSLQSLAKTIICDKMKSDSKSAIMSEQYLNQQSNFWHGTQNPTQIETAT